MLNSSSAPLAFTGEDRDCENGIAWIHSVPIRKQSFLSKTQGKLLVKKSIYLDIWRLCRHETEDCRLHRRHCLALVLVDSGVAAAVAELPIEALRRFAEIHNFMVKI